MKTTYRATFQLAKEGRHVRHIHGTVTPFTGANVVEGLLRDLKGSEKADNVSSFVHRQSFLRYLRKRSKAVLVYSHVGGAESMN